MNVNEQANIRIFPPRLQRFHELLEKIEVDQKMFCKINVM